MDESEKEARAFLERHPDLERLDIHSIEMEDLTNTECDVLGLHEWLYQREEMLARSGGQAVIWKIGESHADTGLLFSLPGRLTQEQLERWRQNWADLSGIMESAFEKVQVIPEQLPLPLEF